MDCVFRSLWNCIVEIPGVVEDYSDCVCYSLRAAHELEGRGSYLLCISSVAAIVKECDSYVFEEKRIVFLFFFVIRGL